MFTLKELEQKISKLRPKDLKEFRAWFGGFDAASWDSEFEKDAASGKLDAIADKAIEDYKKGHCRELWGNNFLC